MRHPQRMRATEPPSATAPEYRWRAIPAANPLQEAIGNQAVLGLVRGAEGADKAFAPVLSLRVAARTSALERDAEAVSRAAKSAHTLLQAAPAGGPSPVPGSPGVPLPIGVERQYGGRLGADLHAVRIHDDPAAHAFSAAAGARAATLGSDIYFSRGRYRPERGEGQRLLLHELTHTLQPDRAGVLHRTPEGEAELASVEAELQTLVITEERSAELGRRRAELLAEGNTGGPDTSAMPFGPSAAPAADLGAFGSYSTMQLPGLAPQGGLDAGVEFAAGDAGSGGAVMMDISEEEFARMTGQSAATLPSAIPSAASGGLGISSLFLHQPDWYYRVLAGPRPILTGPQAGGGFLPGDPTLAEILAGRSIPPRPIDPGNIFRPGQSPGEMTFRHLRASGNVPRIGTDRISAARNLEAFQNVLANRGTGELARIDPALARRLGGEFLSNPEILEDLALFERQVLEQLEAARAANRGANYIRGLEDRLVAVRSARSRAVFFGEGQGVGQIPARAVSPVKGASVSDAALREAALLRNLRWVRYGGRVLLVAGAALSVHRVATAPAEQRGRVAAQEAGGWAFSLAGAWAGAKLGALGGAALGIETGPGAIATGAVGGIIGAGIGFFGGQEAADWLYGALE